MAVDTAQKRRSLSGFGGLFFNGPGIIPDGSFDQADRQAMAYAYSGILSGIGYVAADFVVTKDEAIRIPSATTSLRVPYATVTIKV